jgi:hypothetical protein
MTPGISDQPADGVRDPRSLTPHPELARLFEPLSAGEQAEITLEMAGGQPFKPLLVDRRDRVLAGEEHWRGALELGWDLISVLVAPDLGPARLAALMVAENIAAREVRGLHLSRGMNNFFDMAPLRPPGGW